MNEEFTALSYRSSLEHCYLYFYSGDNLMMKTLGGFMDRAYIPEKSSLEQNLEQDRGNGYTITTDTQEINRLLNG